MQICAERERKKKKKSTEAEIRGQQLRWYPYNERVVGNEEEREKKNCPDPSLNPGGGFAHANQGFIALQGLKPQAITILAGPTLYMLTVMCARY